MEQRITLGGDRLGSGNKMKVEMHGYGRSTHNLSEVLRTTMSAGTLVPALCKVALPEDTWDIDIDVDVKTHPTVGPLFGGFKVSVDVFLIPARLYNGQVQYQKLGIGKNMGNVKIPQLVLEAPQWTADQRTAALGDLDNSQINPSNVLAYLDLRGIGIGNEAAATGKRYFNVMPWLMYWDTVKTYYVNKQETQGWVIHSTPVDVPQNVASVDIVNGINTGTVAQAPAVNPIQLDATSALTITKTVAAIEVDNIMVQLDTVGWIHISEWGVQTFNSTTQTDYGYRYAVYGNAIILNWRYVTGTDLPVSEIDLHPYDLTDIDAMREKIMAHVVNPAPLYIDKTETLLPYAYMFEEDGEFRSLMGSQEGLAVKCYQSDIYNNWLDSETIDNVNTRSAIDTTAGFFTIDQINMSNKVYQYLNRIAVSDGSVEAWYDATYTQQRTVRSNSPMLMGGLVKELVFQEVISQSEASGAQGSQPLGTIAGKGVMRDKHKGGHVHIKVDEIGVIMAIASITPRIDYSQGNAWHTQLKTWDDFHKPQMDQIGFEDSINEWRAWWTTFEDNAEGWTQTSAGKVPAWINYQTSTNRIRGNFAIANNEMFMVLTRRYEPVADGVRFKIKDLTTYIDPRKYNHIFAQTSLDSQNFWVQIGFNINTRRLMSAKIMPNL